MTTLAQLDAHLHAAPLVAQWSCFHRVGQDVVDEVRRAAARRGWHADYYEPASSVSVSIPNRFGGDAFRVTLWA